MDFINNANNYLDEAIKLRRWLHQHPEKGFNEFKTSEFIVSYLNELNIKYTKSGATGIIAELNTGRPGKTIALRADIDALPVIEETKLPFKSQNEGFMHACGHDSHTAMLMTTIKFVKDHLHEYNGCFRFLFQPAEETPPGGAIQLIDDAALQGVDYVYGLHCSPEVPVGSISVIDGPMMAAADKFEATIIGKGGHGASPHQTVDAVVLAAQVINNLQTIVSRNVNPQHAAVLTIGQINGGFRFNVIAEKVELAGTVRTLLPEVRELVKSRIEEVIANTVKAQGGDYQFTYTNGYPPLINHKESVDVLRNVGNKLLGEGKVIEIPFASMLGEDFAYYVQDKPGSFFRLGTKLKQGEQYPLHHSKFTIEEDALTYGIKMFAGLLHFHNKN
ncbi:amidohydrolase [Clostridium sp. 'deep sea']|uniref:M20 metallopeptidase family protein n=1 Tax=Clostridium sp. 'deep sea' TaxID=2779445 RepID=UPI0018964110|nr:amidohydrolase [Clostridium sp. 'deep sea']QOR36585.1 amidohydrolase [Clostridium sp. 'deep sea']